MLRLLIPLFQYSHADSIVYALLALVALVVIPRLGIAGWIYLWNRKWVKSHSGMINSILLLVFAMPGAALFLNTQTASELLHHKERFYEQIEALNGSTLDGAFSALPSHLPKEQQAERLFSALCSQTRSPLPFTAKNFSPPQELKSTLEALYANRVYDSEVSRIFFGCKDRLDMAIKKTVADAQFSYNQAELKEWAALPDNSRAQTLALLWLLLWVGILTWSACADIRVVPAVVSR